MTESLNRLWYERNTGQTIECVRHRLSGAAVDGATLDSMVAGSGDVFEAKFILPLSLSEEATEKHMAQLKHVGDERQGSRTFDHHRGRQIGRDHHHSRFALPAPPAHRKFWRCVESGEPPRLFGLEPPRPRIAAVRTVDRVRPMLGPSLPARFAGPDRPFSSRNGKAELKGLMPEDAKEATGRQTLHRSSETIGTIAGALAKAPAELTNPEKP
jgi:hypothetical protein